MEKVHFGNSLMLHLGRMCGTVRSGQNGQKCPQKLNKLSDTLVQGVKKGGPLGRVKKGGAGGLILFLGALVENLTTLTCTTLHFYT